MDIKDEIRIMVDRLKHILGSDDLSGHPQGLTVAPKLEQAGMALQDAHDALPETETPATGQSNAAQTSPQPPSNDPPHAGGRVGASGTLN